MAGMTTIVLITGANGGIGFELAAQLLTDPSKHVLLGCRSVNKGQAAIKDLQSRNHVGSVELLQLDVSNEDSIKAAANFVLEKHGRLDALVNNAGIAGLSDDTLSQQMIKNYEINAIGPELMGRHFAPLLHKSNGTPRIINVSSSQSSISRRAAVTASDFDVLGISYRASKAAMNMVTASQVAKYGQHGFKVFAYCPGFCTSALTHANTSEYGAKPASEGAAPMVGLINGERDHDQAELIHETGIYGW